MRSILQGLYKNGAFQLMIEGGRQVLDSFLKENLWNEARVITNEKVLKTGIKSPQVTGKVIRSYQLASDRIDIIRNEKPAF